MLFFSNSSTSKLSELRLFPNEVRLFWDNLFKSTKWNELGTKPNNVEIRIEKISKSPRRYCMLINCDNLCGVEDKEAYLVECAEQAIQHNNIRAEFADIAVMGMATAGGRLAVFSSLRGNTPPPVHQYALCKLPGEAEIHIEDPRTDVLASEKKLQSRLDDQVCCFAVTALCYLGYRMCRQNNELNDTPALLSTLHGNHQLRKLIQSLERKVGQSTETKAEVINQFIADLQTMASEEFVDSLIQDINCRASVDMSH